MLSKFFMLNSGGVSTSRHGAVFLLIFEYKLCRGTKIAEHNSAALYRMKNLDTANIGTLFETANKKEEKVQKIRGEPHGYPRTVILMLPPNTNGKSIKSNWLFWIVQTIWGKFAKARLALKIC